ncbi:MAG: leucine-rich repeat domain-containing protein [Alistipes sp.]|nr:leucine-rich repeat domain-containing protein [Alistipes sp.]
MLLLLAGCGMAEGDEDDRKRSDYLTFSDSSFMAYCIETYDLNGDGRFSRYEAERVVEIDCSGREIASLDELDDFVHLRRLDCSENRLQRLDLRPCDELEAVACQNNALMQLEVDELRSLESLNCANNALQRLDLASNGSLRQLDARANGFTTLDLSLCSGSLQADVRGNAQLATLYYRVGQQIAYESPTVLVMR